MPDAHCKRLARRSGLLHDAGLGNRAKCTATSDATARSPRIAPICAWHVRCDSCAPEMRMTSILATAAVAAALSARPRLLLMSCRPDASVAGDVPATLDDEVATLVDAPR
jgi:hypothetical protein